MTHRAPERYDVLVVGAGPGGLAAAETAAAHGARVGLIDLQPRAGGQVWRHDQRVGAQRAARRCIAAVERAGVDLHLGCQVVDADGREMLVEGASGAGRLRFEALILATGARELLLPFPGWTLPGVSGAGGLQALAKQGWPVAGKRVVVAGSGPLLLAAAATLRSHGARLLGVFEQASFQAVAAFARGLWRWPARAAQAARLRWQLRAVAYRCGHLVRAAHGDGALRAIEVADPDGRVSRLDCDLLAVGFGLVPNVELPALLGCTLERWGAHERVRVDSLQRTSMPGVYAVGEACGIGGLQPALLEGVIAAHTALGHPCRARALLVRRDRARRYAAAMIEAFALDERVRALASPDTLICRCEDVPLGALESFADARAAKLATRCGMGPCQGRICGAALAELGRFQAYVPGLPLFPARLATLAGAPTLDSNGAIA